jgi:hypothetical protein
VRQPRHREPTIFVSGTLTGIQQGVPRTFHVETDTGRFITAADGNIEAIRGPVANPSAATSSPPRADTI